MVISYAVEVGLWILNDYEGCPHKAKLNGRSESNWSS